MTPGVIAAFIVAVLLIAAPFTTRKLTVAAEGVSWIALIAGIAMAIWGQGLTTGDAIALATLGASGVASYDFTGWRRVSATIGVTVLAVAIGCLVAKPQVADGGRYLDVMMGCWAALAACYGILVTIIAKTKSSTELALPFVTALTAAAAAAMATSRSSLGGFGYYLFLKGNDGPLFWTLPGVDKLPGGIRLTVALSMPPWVIYTAIAAAVLSVVLILTKRWMPPIAPVVVSAAVAIALAVVAVAPTQATQKGAPDVQRYEDYARQALMKAQAEPQFSTQGKFTNETKIEVDHARHGIDLSFFLAASLLMGVALLSFAGRLRDDKDLSAGEDYEMLAVKAGGFIWLAWLLSALVHYLFWGTPGMRGPAEWWFTGLGLLATGLLLVSARTSPAGRGFVAAIIVGLLAWTVAVNAIFGNFPGLSVSIL